MTAFEVGLLCGVFGGAATSLLLAAAWQANRSRRRPLPPPSVHRADLIQREAIARKNCRTREAGQARQALRKAVVDELRGQP